jgi:cyclopropane-fatty-acyl-phospholipid synthase
LEFDRIVTNEMFEHMKNYDRLFEKVSKWLKPETGLLFIHVFCHRNYFYQFKVKSSNNADWMAKNYFTGGSMPSYGQFARAVLVDVNEFLDTFLFFKEISKE